MPSDEQCVLHERWLADIHDRTEKIEIALLGTLEEPGYITKTEKRLLTLEGFKKFVTAVTVWVLRVTGAALVTGIIGFLIAALV